MGKNTVRDVVKDNINETERRRKRAWLRKTNSYSPPFSLTFWGFAERTLIVKQLKPGTGNRGLASLTPLVPAAAAEPQAPSKFHSGDSMRHSTFITHTFSPYKLLPGFSLPQSSHNFTIINNNLKTPPSSSTLTTSPICPHHPKNGISRSLRPPLLLLSTARSRRLRFPHRGGRRRSRDAVSLWGLYPEGAAQEGGSDSLPGLWT